MSKHDPGLANERTALAWQRTALSLVAGAAIVARLTADDAGTLVLIMLVLAAVLGLWVVVESSARYRHSTGRTMRPRGRGGRAALTLTVAITLLALGELLVILS
ncbi:DUF202 domain-containing protein [Nocardioides alcanivorans]|uniref:DUF202 domain-containing protein n=1 Tax=Nocardioides alcanivorans TaxID=2897352 RepID=UPI0024B04143|nr:DUF202 domain-containing protein [Nocardioides alcanivorans]